MNKALIILLFILSVTLVNGQKIQRGIDVKIGYNSPVFNFDDAYDGGIGINVGILYPFYDNLQFSLNTGYTKWGFDNMAFNLKNTNEHYTSFDITAPLTIVPFTFGVKYYATNTKVRPYFSAELGFFYYTQKVSGTYTWVGKPGATEEAYTLAELKSSGFKPMANIGAGVITPINEEWILDFQIKMNALLNAQSVSGSNNEGAVEGTSSTHFYITIAAGINYYFGS